MCDLIWVFSGNRSVSPIRSPAGASRDGHVTGASPFSPCIYLGERRLEEATPYSYTQHAEPEDTSMEVNWRLSRLKMYMKAWHLTFVMTRGVLGNTSSCLA